MAVSLLPKASAFTWSPVNIFFICAQEICFLITAPNITLFKETQYNHMHHLDEMHTY